MESTGHHAANHEIPIFIDDNKFNAPSHSMTGQALRDLPSPPIPEKLDLWLDIPNSPDDLLIRPEATYEIKPGSHYYTAPKRINPGAA